MNKLYLLLGSNLGNKTEQLQIAEKKIAEKIGPIIKKSGSYQTAAWGKTDQPDFINQVIIAETVLTADQTMKIIFTIEESMGRIRTEKNAARIIDIDILFFNDEIIHTDLLKVPHPLIRDRRFVLIPLNELSPRLKHPLLKKTIGQLLQECTDKLEVKEI